MNRFFIENVKETKGQIVLSTPDEVHHLKNVLKINPSEKIAIFDNSGNEYIAIVKEILPNSVKMSILEKNQRLETGIKITVGCAIPKNAKMDEIIDKLTQLGVECIIPLETERVIVRLNKQKKSDRLERWKKISLSAAKQSQRSRLPEIKPISPLNDVLAENNFDLKLIPTLEEKEKTIKEVFKKGTVNKVIVLIGPEGDFSPSELNLAKESGFVPVTLGRQVLRVDTAALAVVSFIKLNEG